MKTNIDNAQIYMYKSSGYSNVKFILVFLFALSVFLVSNDDSLKIASMNASTIAAILMFAIYIIDGLIKGQFILHRHPGQQLLLLLLIWAIISLVVAKYHQFPGNIYSFEWAQGLNSPDWRGMAFLVRLFLAFFSIEFIVTNINSMERYMKVINFYLILHTFFAVLVLIQIIAYIILGIEIGHIVIQDNTFRVGGYIGEPSTLCGILIVGFFLVLSLMDKKIQFLWFSKKILLLVFIISTIDLFFTFSAAWIPAVLLSLFIEKIKNIKILSIAIIMLIGLSFISLFFLESVLYRFVNEISSINIRTSSWLAGLRIFFDYIISGVGIGQSPFYMPFYMDALFAYEFIDIMRFPPMNTYIQVLAEMGIVGIILIFTFYFILIRSRLIVTGHSLQTIVTLGFGGGILTTAIAINGVPDYFYSGSMIFMISMYLSGIKLSKSSISSVSKV